MLKILIASTLTNPNDDNARTIKVKLLATEQEVEALFINPINLDRREQNTNIKIGTEVFVLVDEISNYYVVGTTQQGIELEQDKVYIVENEKEIRLLTNDLLKIESIDGNNIQDTTIKSDKVEIDLKTIRFTNDTAELIATMSDTLQAIIDLVVIGNMGVPATLDPATIAALSEQKAKLDSFKM